jgi:hypothetical protein
MIDRKRIRALNDSFRQSMSGGKVVTTASLSNHPELGRILDRVRTYDDFTQDNDPYTEHDFGSFAINGERIFWKIDYYDRTMTEGSLDPSDPAVTTRVLTVLRASEY